MHEVTAREGVNLRAGQRVRAAFAVKYIAGGSRGAATAGAVEFLLDGGPSVLLSCDTDWTLEVTEGRWPELPAWCWPVESWTFERIEGIGSPGLDEVVSSSDLFDAVGEFCGVRLEFPTAWVTIRSGEAVTWDIARKGARPQEGRQDA